MRYAELHSYNLPQHVQSGQEMHPYHEEILVENVEHGVEAVGYRQLLVVGPNTELTVGIYVHVRDIHLRLVPVDVVYLCLVEHHLSGVHMDE